MIRTAFLTLLALVVTLIVVGFFLPRETVIERERVIDQPEAVTFDALADLRRFQHWSPWFDHMTEPDIRFEGLPGEVGSTLVWSDQRSGADGRMWIVGLSRPDRIDLDLELGENEAEVYFLVADEAGSRSRVRWGMQVEFGALDLVGRYAGLLLPRLVGRDYDEGLERLELYLAENSADARSDAFPEGGN